jgi:EpsI family protein
MTEFDQREVSGASVAGHPLRVNRAIIQLGDQRQLVYYWFQQRGRTITNEYLVKWYLLWDAISLNRSDGALVRLITPLKTDEDIVGADARLAGFARAAAPLMNAYVPD